MINESKVKILSKLAGFEKKHRKTPEELEKLTKGRLVAHGVCWTVIMTTVAFLIILILLSVYKGSLGTNWYSFLGGSYDKLFRPGILIAYAAFELFYIVVAIVFYSKKYKNMKKELEEYRRRRTNYNDFYGREDK